MNTTILIICLSIILAVILFGLIFILLRKRKKHDSIEKSEEPLPYPKPEKLEITSDEKQIKNVYGLGGWLIFVQLRLIIFGLVIAGIAYILHDFSIYFGLLAFASFMISLLFLYNLKPVFKIMYIINTVFSLLYAALIYIYNQDLFLICVLSFGAILLIDVLIIVALFKSVRVKNTFLRIIKEKT